MASESLKLITIAVFRHFAAFEQSVTLNLAQRSFKIIHFGRTRKPVHYFLLAVYRTSINFSSIFHSFGDINDGFIRAEPSV